MYKLGKDEQMNPKVWRKEKILKVTAEIKQKNEKKNYKTKFVLFFERN
jgi:hypothetical protein